MVDARRGLITLVIVLGVACAGQDPRPDRPEPDWVAGTSERYPSAQYLLGRGQGGTPDQARERARADLAKSVTVTVEARSQQRESFRSDGGGRDDSPDTELAVSREIVTGTDTLLRGAEIVDQWADPEDGSHHALAALDRGRLAQSLRDRIRSLDAATGSYLEQARGAESLLPRIAAASRAVASQRERRRLATTLAAIAPTGQRVAPRWQLEQLAADRDELLSRFRVHPRISDDDTDGALHSLLGSALSRAGFTVAGEESDTASEEAYTARAHFEGGEPSRREGWYWARGRLQVSLVSPEGRVLGTRRWPVKASATDAETARQRALDEIGRILDSELRDTLVGFAVPEDEQPDDPAAL